MKTRKTVRILLFGPDRTLLLMKVHDNNVTDPANSLSAPFWVTIGGRIEDGEDLLTAAKREALEETGLDNITFGDPIWHGQQVLHDRGEPKVYDETFITAYCHDRRIAPQNLSPDEKNAILAYRWWPIPEIEQSTERILPAMLTELIGPVANGILPQTVIEIDLGPLKR
jgi:8-oxo-dGTP pyrophosphatase MutT (NUDIX family)